MGFNVGVICRLGHGADCYVLSSGRSLNRKKDILYYKSKMSELKSRGSTPLIKAYGELIEALKGEEEITPILLPKGIKPLPRNARQKQKVLFLRDLHNKRTASLNIRDGKKGGVLDDLKQIDGIYIPGGQDTPFHQSSLDMNEKKTRASYEDKVITLARNMGIPILSVCGGSRSLLRGFGGIPTTLKGNAKQLHKSSHKEPVHEVFPVAQSMKGLKTKGIKVDWSKEVFVGSSHEKVAKLSDDRLVFTLESVENVNVFDGAQVALEVTLIDPVHMSVEGFATTYGVPMMGITSHPETIFGSRSRWGKFSANDVMFADAIMRMFMFNMSVRRNRRSLMDQLKMGSSLPLIENGVKSAFDPCC